MHAIAIALADPVVRMVYLVFGCALLIVPMIALGIWYHRQMKRLPGGNAVLKQQQQVGTDIGTLGPAIDFGRAIAAGRYGPDIRQLQNTMYLLVGLWLVINALVFGVFIWADEVNRS